MFAFAIEFSVVVVVVVVSAGAAAAPAAAAALGVMHARKVSNTEAYRQECADFFVVSVIWEVSPAFGKIIR